jgi:hypothetical protein
MIKMTKLLPLFLLLTTPLGLSADCDSCYHNGCIDKIEYVDYKPWETGDDAGLWCLPGSRCIESLPTRPTGAEIYKDLSCLNHKSRYPSEYTPEQWRTIMLHMRVILPMTAWDHRMILSFMQGQQVKSKNESEVAATKDVAANSNGNELAQNNGSLEETIGSVSAANTFASIVPANIMSYTSKFNYVFSGQFQLWYLHPCFDLFGDIDGNNSFFYTFDPIFVVSYGDNLLMASKIGSYNFLQSTGFFLYYAYVAYVYNDYLTALGGKFIIPFGSYYNLWVSPWIRKTAFNPYCRYGLEFFAITPLIDIGFEVKGAIPLCNLSDCLYRAKFTYDLWIGNGPNEVNSFTGVPFPNGSIYYDAIAPNNNNEFTWGCRFAFLPNDSQWYGISYLRGRWSSNKVAFSADGLGKKRVYEAACFDWNIHFSPSILFRGEYIWTQYEGNVAEFPWVRNTAYWAQLSFKLDLINCICPDIYCWKPCLWDSMEFTIQSEMIWCQPSGRTDFGFDYSGFDKRAFTLNLAYYFTQTLSAKLQYNFNYGDKAHNFVRESFTGPSKKTGFGNNNWIFELAYGW